MQGLQTWLNKYGESHKNKTNKLIHWLCVPCIFFCVLALFSLIELPILEQWLPANMSNFASVVVFLGLIVGASVLADKEKFCTLMVDRQVDGEKIVGYKGTTIELCCSACVKKFKKDPDYYVKLAKGLLPQISEKLVAVDLKLMDQKFCLVFQG